MGGGFALWLPHDWSNGKVQELRAWQAWYGTADGLHAPTIVP